MTTVLERRTVVYCGACGMPPEYCRFGPDFETHCNPWLVKHHPELYAQKTPSSTHPSSASLTESKILSQPLPPAAVAAEVRSKPSRPWTTEERLVAFYNKYQPDKLDSVPGLLEKYVGKELQLFQALIKKYGPEPFDPFYAEDEEEEEDDDDDDDDDDSHEEDLSKLTLQEDKKSRRGVAAKTTLKMETRVIIQKISRNKKKATTSVIGMDTVPDMKLKDVAKAFSKKFAGSSSVKDLPNGKKEIILQGDHMDEVAIMVVEQFKVNPEVVFLDIDGEFVPFLQH